MLIDPLPTFASATSRSACKVWEIALIVLPRGIRLQRHELPAFTCLPSCLQAKAAIFNCFLQSLDEVQSGDANRPHRPHPICSASQPTNNMVFFVTPWKIQTMAFDGLNNCKCDKRLKRRCYGATFIQDMEKEGHQTNQRHNNCHSYAATRPRFKFSIRVVFSFSS